MIARAAWHGRLALRAGLVSFLALSVLLCAGGGAAAAVALLDPPSTLPCGATEGPKVQGYCRATGVELPWLVLPGDAALFRAPRPVETAAVPPAEPVAPHRPSEPRAPRSPPLAER